MSKSLRLVLSAMVACICQTNFAGYLRIAGVAPDMMIAFLVAITTYCGAYGGFCVGAVMAMFYDASVGYVLAINLVGYTAIGWAAPLLRGALDAKLKKLKHKSYLEMLLICFFLTMLREVLYIGYLFLIGAEQSLVTLMRALLCSGYSALMVLPVSLIMRPIMNWHPRFQKKSADLREEENATETHR